MNTSHETQTRGRSLIAIAVASILLAACAAAPVRPSGAEEARAKLTQLQSDPNLASKAPAAIAEAERAVQAAEQPQTDQSLGQYRVYIADRKVDIARAQAQTRYFEDQRTTLEAQRQSARLDARTREADVATNRMERAQADDATQRLIASQAQIQADAAQAQANQARSDADSANMAAVISAQQSAQQSAELQHQIDTLNARVTDRGLVLTLGDVLFTTGRSDLLTGATVHLDKLVAFLNRYPDREVMIEGYTDSVGSQDYNQGLSERRAESVRHYLTGQGIDSGRLTASGKGESNPVAGNDSATGRQQNRRVEVIISNPTIASR
ncbi:MAG: OmpA family protein [Steroidobacteraceae bacterium]|jgi:outer membrane protein OmpA-like peptidoglycan-associated protein